jgi:predicted amidohydrolase
MKKMDNQPASFCFIFGATMAAAQRCLAGLVQMRSVNDVAKNFATCRNLVGEATAKGCKIVFFPECFSFIGAKAGEAQQIAEPLTGPTMRRYQELAREHEVWLSLGGFQEVCEGDSRIYNTHVILDSSGCIQASYRKIHLFDVPMTGLVESRQAVAGDALVVCDSPAGRLGVTICYDMRFPEVYQKLTFLHGARVLLMPSAFAMKTGKAHWETLLRARAIETQCYVVAAAQVGMHNTDGNRRESWGHALAIDQWGTIVASHGADGLGVTTFEVDLAHGDATRANMPIHEHRRYDIYGDGPHQAGATAAGAGQKAPGGGKMAEEDDGLFFTMSRRLRRSNSSTTSQWANRALLVLPALAAALLGLAVRGARTGFVRKH